MKTATVASIAMITTLVAACSEKTNPVAPEPQIDVLPVETPPISYVDLGAGTFSFTRTITPRSIGVYFVDSRAGTISVLPRVLGYKRMSPDGQSFVEDSFESWIPSLYLYDRSGSRTHLTPTGKWAENPTWSYDGKRIFFMTLDTGIASVLEVTPGTGVIAPTPVKGAAVLCDDIGWVSESASGKMLFLWNLPEGNACSGDGIFSMNANGTGLTQLQPSKIKDLIVTPVWSPDEKTIAFGKHSDWSGATYTNSIFAMNPDGTSLRLLAKLPANANMGYVGVYPSICWSADGSRILFINNENGDEAHIYTVRADGTGLTQITFGHVWDSSISCGR